LILIADMIAPKKAARAVPNEIKMKNSKIKKSAR